eukprot:TRINITY_DN3680_c0_g1_i1.p1 TRINITY_DN3680_c0_g1~~TRINITY_DN3680_c0_g1_i1.p1  ORF type:complete len:1109 (+),score=248.65 TRINITY_DN3680_c0_g1_i1:119-3445(+)
MVLSEALLGGAATVNTVWHYNRSNYMYDRKMRQEQELKILEWRKEQAALWREDIRDIIGLTEKKMDSYLIISVLQVEMCVALFTEGRLEPGTPPWLLHFYMLTLGAAFMYLLMSTWLCMHASVVASCSSARLLTQFVRLPIPTWEQLQEMRTFGDTFENKRVGEMLRVPFTGDVSAPLDAARDREAPGSPATSVPGSPSAAPLLPRTSDESYASSSKKKRGTSPSASKRSGDAEREWADPWHSELTGGERDIYELLPQPAALRRHVQLAKRAAAQYQCYDAFARVSMTFGTNQLLHAVAYYALGYVCVQDGASWAAGSVVAIMAGIAMALVHLDFSLTRLENYVAQALIFCSFGCTAAATFWWNMEGLKAKHRLMFVLPMAYAAHGLWLFWALRACGLLRQPDGVVLPMRFRAVLYLDVFGWFYHGPQQRTSTGGGGKASSIGRGKTWVWGGEPPVSYASLAAESRDLKAELSLWKSASVQRAMGQIDRDEIEELARRVSEAEMVASPPPRRSYPWSSLEAKQRERVTFAASSVGFRKFTSEGSLVRLRGHDDGNTPGAAEVAYYFDPESGETFLDDGDHLGDDEMRKIRTIDEFQRKVDKYCKDAKQIARRNHKAVGGEGFLDRLDKAAKEAAHPVLHAFGAVESDDEDFGFRPAAESALASDAPPSGEVQVPPNEVFHPQSYANTSDDGAYKSNGCSNEIVTGHDQTHPGRLPAKVFKSATLLVICLWMLGLSVPFGILRDFLVDPLQADVFVKAMTTPEEGTVDRVDALVGTDPSGLPMLIPQGRSEEPPALPPGELVHVGWPMHSAFVPRSLACDSTGTVFVVSDDFTMYASALQQNSAGMATPATVAAGAAPVAPGSAARYSLNFKRVPMCTSLEGKELEDIDVACAGAGGVGCKVFALHSHASELSSCPIVGYSGAVATPAEARTFVQPPKPWILSKEWLRSDEKPPEIIKSAAVNNACVRRAAGGETDLGDESCTVVGTSDGRILELKSSSLDRRVLVPHRIVHQRGQTSPRGALAILSNGVALALLHASQTLEAFDSAHGVSLGVWAMPKGTMWLMICGADDQIYSLGVENGKRVVIYRFPVPERIRAVQRPALQEHQEI